MVYVRLKKLSKLTLAIRAAHDKANENDIAYE
jgi:hypothetical protein